jgi:hypothetical protein
VLRIRILIFTPSRIPDPKSATKERGEKKTFVIPFCSHKFHRTENYFIFEMLKKKMWPVFKEIYRTFYPKICHMGLGSGGQKAPDPGSGSRSATLE